MTAMTMTASMMIGMSMIAEDSMIVVTIKMTVSMLTKTMNMIRTVPIP